MEWMIEGVLGALTEWRGKEGDKGVGHTNGLKDKFRHILKSALPDSGISFSCGEKVTLDRFTLK